MSNHRFETLQVHAGQYIEFILRDGARRSYSMANAPHNGPGVELHIRHMPGGKFTDHVFTAMKEKEILRVEGPFGSFTAAADRLDRRAGQGQVRRHASAAAAHHRSGRANLTLFDTTPQPSGRVTRCNQAMARILGRSADDVLGTPVTSLGDVAAANKGAGSYLLALRRAGPAMTRSMDSTISSIAIERLLRRAAKMADSFKRLDKSAPVKPGVWRAMTGSWRTPTHCARRSRHLPHSGPRGSRRSNRPRRRLARNREAHSAPQGAMRGRSPRGRAAPSSPLP